MLVAVTGVLCVGAVLLWVQTYRAPENVPIRFFAAALTLLAVSSVLRQAPGGSLLSVLANNLINIVNVFIELSFFVVVQLGRPGIRRVRRELVVAAVASAVAVSAYLAAPADLRPVINDSPGFGEEPLVAVFAGSVGIYLVYATSSIVYRITRILPVVTRRVLRVALLIIAVGASLQALAGAVQLFSTVLRFTAGRAAFPADLRPLVAVPVVLGFLALVVGAIVPLVDGVIREVPRIRAQRRAARTLEPLWRELHTEFPELSLELRSPGPGRALYRRVVEIRDGLVLLSPYFDAEVAQRASDRGHGAGEPADDLAVSVQAALVRDALRARRAGEDPPAGTARLEPGTPPGDDVGDWRDDADLLVRLARRFAEPAAAG